MPEFFKKWLESLDKEQAQEMWDYFDGSQYVEHSVTEIVAPIAQKEGADEQKR